MQKLIAHMNQNGFSHPIILDGGFVRFDRNGKIGNAWFVGQEINPGLVIANYGDWVTGEKYRYCSKEIDKTNGEEDKELRSDIHLQALKQTQEKEKLQEESKKVAEYIWGKATPIKEHEYLSKKNVKPYNLRLSDRGQLTAPIYNWQGELCSLQFIEKDGSKKLLSGGFKGYSTIGLDHSKPITKLYLCEGWATGASIHEATGEPVVVCIDAGNIKRVCEALTGKWAGVHVVIAADNDHATKGNPGLEAARATRTIFERAGVKCELRYPEGINGTDYNDMHQEKGLQSVTESLAKENLPAPIHTLDIYERELVKPQWGPPKKQGGPDTPPNQEAVAQALYETYEDIFLKEDSEVFQWTGVYWVEWKPKNFRSFIRLRAQRIMRGRANDKDLNAYFNIFWDKLDSIPSGISFYLQPPYLRNFSDCTLDMKTDGSGFTFREHRKEDYLTGVLPMKINEPIVENKLFRDWINSLLEGDPDKEGKLRALKQIGGACLISMFPRTAFLHGEAQTGKSTFAKLCASFIGENNYTSVQPSLMRQGGFLMESLINKQVNIITDINSDRIDPAIFKQIEDRVKFQINRKNRAVILSHIPALHIFCGNALPKGIDGESDAMDRRVTLIEFTKKMPENYDRDYENKLIEAGQRDILEFFLEGLRDLCASKGKYFNPESGKKKLKEWKGSQSSVGEFLQWIIDGKIEGFSAEKGAEVRGSDLLWAYKEFSKTRFKNDDTGRNSFYKLVEGSGYLSKLDVHEVRYFVGFCVKGKENRNPTTNPEF